MRAAVGAAHVVDNADLHGRVDFVDSKIPKDYEVLLRPHQLHSSPDGVVRYRSIALSGASGSSAVSAWLVLPYTAPLERYSRYSP